MNDRDEPQGYTPPELARLLRVREDKVLAWIRAGELQAVNVASAGSRRPRYVVLPHHLAAWELARAAGRPAKPPPRRLKRTAGVDYYPD